MKSYRSAKDVTRTFYSRCGANVFWDGREKVMDVAVGLLDAGSDARAGELLAWWPKRVKYAQEALDRGLVKAGWIR